MAFLQVNTTATPSNFTGTSGNITIASTTAGNLVVVHIDLQDYTRAVNSVTDNKGNTYASAGSQVASGNNDKYYVFYGVQVTGGATTITVNLNFSSGVNVVVDEYSGGASTNATVFDVNATGTTASGTGLYTINLAPSATGKLIVAFLANNSGVNISSAASGYTLYSNASGYGLSSEYKLSGTTSELPGATWVSTTVRTIIATSFNAAAAANTNGGFFILRRRH